MRKLYVIVALVVVAGVGAYFGSPYWTLHQIRSAAQAGEGDRVASYVDFPAVRESMKTQIAARMQKDLQAPEMKDNPFAALGQTLATGMVNTLVDTMLTPEGVANMIRSGSAAKAGAAPSAPASSTPATSPQPASTPTEEPRVRQGYEGVNIFKAAMLDPKTGEDLMEAVLTRQGLFSWKLTALRMPRLLK